jgi:hypothetical protein
MSAPKGKSGEERKRARLAERQKARKLRRSLDKAVTEILATAAAERRNDGGNAAADRTE